MAHSCLKCDVPLDGPEKLCAVCWDAPDRAYQREYQAAYKKQPGYLEKQREYSRKYYAKKRELAASQKGQNK